MDKYIAALGLPNDSKFRANFNQFGACLPKDEKNHIYTGNGTCRLGSVSSLTLFVQSISLQRIPLAFHIPLWMENLMSSLLPPDAKEAVMRYYSTRLAFFMGGSSQVNPATEYKNLYESACNITKVLNGEHRNIFRAPVVLYVVYVVVVIVVVVVVVLLLLCCVLSSELSVE